MHCLSRGSILVGGLAALVVNACATGYTSARPHTAAVADASASADRVIALDGPRSHLVASRPYPESPDAPIETVYVHANYRADPGVTMALPNLAATGATPCSGGVPATVTVMDRWLVPGDKSFTGRAFWGFPRELADAQGLLTSPTALDIPITHLDGSAPECLRLPIVDGHGDVEWERAPNLSIGYGFELLVPFRRIYGVSAASMFALRFGPWLGPVRLRAEVAIGGAFARADNPNLVAFAYGAGLRADTLLFATRRFGLGAAVGYDVTGITFAPDVDWASKQGSGYQGLIHGPRAGLVFDLLPLPAIGPAFRRKRDSESGSFEIYAAPEWSHDHPAATPALWLMLNVDVGN